MADFVYDGTSRFTIGDFNPETDRVIFTSQSAQDFTWVTLGLGSVDHVRGWLPDGNWVDLLGVTGRGLANSNFWFVDGSSIQFGDGTIDTVPDELTNAATAGTGEDGGVFYGYGGADIFVANSVSGGNRVNGQAGDDELDGGAGADTIRGGQGNDTIIGTDGLGDRFFGDKGNDLISAGAGDDTIFGGVAGDVGDDADHINAGSGDDLVQGNMGSDTIIAGNGSDSVRGGAGDDFITADNLLSGTGSNLLAGDRGNDTIRGGAGDDTLFGGLAGDKEPDDDVLNGGGGDDLIQGNGGSDSIFGSEGDDTIKGGAGTDTIRGGLGSDKIFGNKGDDVIGANDFDDELHGSAGNDRFTLSQTAEQALVIDFDQTGEDAWSIEANAFVSGAVLKGSGPVAQTFVLAVTGTKNGIIDAATFAAGGGMTSKAFFGSYLDRSDFSDALTDFRVSVSASPATYFVWGVNAAGSSLWVASVKVSTGAATVESINTITGSNLDDASDLVLF